MAEKKMNEKKIKRFIHALLGAGLVDDIKFEELKMLQESKNYGEWVKSFLSISGLDVLFEHFNKYKDKKPKYSSSIPMMSEYVSQLRWRS